MLSLIINYKTFIWVFLFLNDLRKFFFEFLLNFIIRSDIRNFHLNFWFLINFFFFFPWLQILNWFCIFQLHPNFCKLRWNLILYRLLLNDHFCCLVGLILGENLNFSLSTNFKKCVWFWFRGRGELNLEFISFLTIFPPIKIL